MDNNASASVIPSNLRRSDNGQYRHGDIRIMAKQNFGLLLFGLYMLSHVHLKNPRPVIFHVHLFMVTAIESQVTTMQQILPTFLLSFDMPIIAKAE